VPDDPACVPQRREDVTTTRREALALLGAGSVLALTGCAERSGGSSAAASRSSAGPTRKPQTKASMQRITYGSDPSQYGELTLPPGSATGLPVIVVVHGGYWRSTYGLELGRPLAKDLVGHGVAVWNIEYRRTGDGGGWPATFEDAAAAMDALADTADPEHRLDLTKVVVVGHSAGGQLAAWLAGRHKLPAGSVGAAPRVRPVGYVSQAGVVDLVRAYEQSLGSGAVELLVGGSPTTFPERYAVGSPYALLPLGVPGTLVHGLDDETVPIDQSDRFSLRAKETGDLVTEIRLPGVEHFMLIDPTTAAWAACREAALGYLRSR
jgi:acetyl esterase/lipase